MVLWLKKFSGSIVMLPPPFGVDGAQVDDGIRGRCRCWRSARWAVLGDGLTGSQRQCGRQTPRTTTSRVPPRHSGVLSSVWVPSVTMFSTPSSVTGEAAIAAGVRERAGVDRDRSGLEKSCARNRNRVVGAVQRQGVDGLGLVDRDRVGACVWR